MVRIITHAKFSGKKDLAHGKLSIDAVNKLLEVIAKLRKQADFLKFQIYLRKGNQYMAINTARTYTS